MQSRLVRPLLSPLADRADRGSPAPLDHAASAAPLPPPVTLGPYRLGVEFVERSRLQDRRKRVCINLEDGRVEFRDDLQGLSLAEAFLECIIRLSHFSKGCQQGCVEEAYTHSFATGMVEFVQRNPQAWVWFNLLLSRHLAPHVGYDRIVTGTVALPPRMPRRVLVAGHPVTIRSISKAESGNAFGWYHLSKREAQLYEGLKGSNLAVVALHELTHAIHHLYALKNRDQHHMFRRAQLRGWFGIMTQCPGAWRWLAWVMSNPAEAGIVVDKPISSRFAAARLIRAAAA
jgi:hypothetical protein